MTPVSIISGFLGAGKTTLLRRILQNPDGRRLGVLVNDFGALNIDADQLSEVHSEVVSLKNGCVCCSIADDLIGATARLLRVESPPDHVLVETSGVSDPRKVAEAFFSSDLKDLVSVDGIFCVVDCLNFEDLDYAAGELAIDQAAVADIVILNKTDLVEEATIEAITKTLRGAFPSMRTVRSVQSNVPLEFILDPASGAADHAHGPTCDVHCGHNHRHDASFKSWTWLTDRPLQLETFRECVKRLPPSVYRAKGILTFVDKPGEYALFNLVGKRSSLDFRMGPAPKSESSLVAIGLADSLPVASLREIFEGAAG